MVNNGGRLRTVAFRVTDEQHDRLIQSAGGKGKLSAYCRKRCLGSATRVSEGSMGTLGQGGLRGDGIPSSVRFTRAERRTLELLAERSGYGSLSAYVRSKVFEPPRVRQSAVMRRVADRLRALSNDESIPDGARRAARSALLDMVGEGLCQP